MEILNKNDVLEQIKDNIGKIYSWDYVFTTILGLSQQEYINNLKEIEKEKKDKLLKNLYQSDDEY